MGHKKITNENSLTEELKRMSFSESLAFEIATTQARLEELEDERKKLKKKLKTLSAFLSEISTPVEEPPYEEVR